MPRKSFSPAQVPTSIALESVRVATPCHADWEKMRGDDRSRFCPSCAKNVYNLSAMTSVEAQELLQEKEGHLCVRFFQREDGTMLTQDCPVGVAALKERSPSFALWAGVASLILLAGALLSPTVLSSAQAQPEPHLETAPAQTATPIPTEEPSYPAVMGDVVATPRPTVAPTLAPASLTPTMGKPTIPRATPAPEVKSEDSTSKALPTQTMVLGRMILRPTPAPTPAAPAQVMGLISAPHPKALSHQKTKKRSSKTKRS